MENPSYIRCQKCEYDSSVIVKKKHRNAGNFVEEKMLFFSSPKYSWLNIRHADLLKMLEDVVNSDFLINSKIWNRN